MPQYSKTSWVDGTAPAISAANLNKLEQGVFDSIRQDGSTTMSAQLVTIAGSAATPAIAPTGDSNTGIFFPAADTIAFGEGGLEAMRITSAGNVGIGTTEPDVFTRGYSKILAVSSTADSAININSATGNLAHLDLGVNATRLFSITVAAGSSSLSTITNVPMYFNTNSSPAMTITGAGNVGIGTISPNDKLEVVGGIRRKQVTAGTTISPASEIGLQYQFDNTANRSGIYFLNSYNSNGAAWMSFWTSNTSNVFSEKMRIDAAGNVGIGTTSPADKLHVEGNIYMGTANPTVYTSSTNNLVFQVGTGAMIFKRNAGANESIRVDGNGYLLIGYTGSNGAYPLQVNGQIFATSSTIATSDGRYKKDIVSLDGALDIVAALNPVQFNWKDHPVHKFNTDVPTIGFIAQEVAEVLKDKAYLTSVIKKSECTWETETGETVDRQVTRDVETQVTREVEREITEIVDGEEVTQTVTEEITETVIEQVTEIITEPVKETHTEEFLGIAESNMIAILTKAVQELKAEVDALKAQLAK